MADLALRAIKVTLWSLGQADIKHILPRWPATVSTPPPAAEPLPACHQRHPPVASTSAPAQPQQQPPPKPQHGAGRTKVAQPISAPVRPAEH